MKLSYNIIIIIEYYILKLYYIIQYLNSFKEIGQTFDRKAQPDLRGL